MKILAVETSGRDLSVAAADGPRVLIERVLDTAAGRNARLLVPQVRECLQELSWRPADVDVTAVSIGPGRFTGLRVGVVFARTFAWAAETRLVAVDTLQACAQRLLPCDEDIAVITDAQRGDVFTGTYRGGTVAEPTEPVRIAPLAEVLQQAAEHPRIRLTGSAVDSMASQIPAGLLTAPPPLRQPRASALIPIACRAADRGNWQDPEKLEPVYLRPSYAEEKRQS